MLDEKLIGAGAGVGAWLALINNWAVSLFNVPLSVVGMAAAGTLLSYGYGDAVKPTKKKTLYLQAAFITFGVVVAVAVVPAFMGWEWVTPERQAPLAGLMGLGGRFMVPLIQEYMPEIVRKIFRLDAPKKKDNNANEPEAKT